VIPAVTARPAKGRYFPSRLENFVAKGIKALATMWSSIPQLEQ
jgi:hypothetical protein